MILQWFVISARFFSPHRCSSISATQSFDMRVYGRTGGGGGFNGPGGAATLGRPTPKPKLDNRYRTYMGYMVISVEDPQVEVLWTHQ